MEQMTAEQPCGAQGLGVVLRWSFTFPQSVPGSPSGSLVTPTSVVLPVLVCLEQNISLLSLTHLIFPFS